jgi:hypothetical protein
MASLARPYAQYGEKIEELMRQRSSPQLTLDIATLARLLSYHYESIRRIVAGEAVPSRELNDSLASLLNADRDDLWQIAERARIAKRFAGMKGPVPAPPDESIREFWTRLTPDDQRLVVDLVASLAEKTSVKKEAAQASVGVTAIQPLANNPLLRASFKHVLSNRQKALSEESRTKHSQSMKHRWELRKAKRTE